MNGFKYLTGTAACMVAVLLGFIVVLGQFNLMVYPAHITAFSFNTGEKGICRIEFLGEKAQLPMPDPELWNKWETQSRQILMENAYQALEKAGRAVMQAWDAGIRDLALEGKIERLLNTFEKGVQIPWQERLQRCRGDGR